MPCRSQKKEKMCSVTKMFPITQEHLRTTKQRSNERLESQRLNGRLPQTYRVPSIPDISGIFLGEQRAVGRRVRRGSLNV
jgi:hypothetical protein